MSVQFFDDGQDKEQGFLRRHRAGLVAGGFVLAVISAAAFFLTHGDNSPARKVNEFQVVKIMPPPPPPPPPAPQPPEQKMIEQPKMVEPEVKQERVLDKPKPDQAPPDKPLGLDAKAEGPGDSFNLVGNAGGNGLLEGGGGGGSRWGWYASMVQDQIAEAIRANKLTRKARFNVEVQVWVDPAGKIQRVHLKTSTGNAEIDDAITNDVLAGLVLKEPPPKDMPMPMVMRNIARRPG